MMNFRRAKELILAFALANDTYMTFWRAYYDPTTPGVDSWPVEARNMFRSLYQARQAAEEQLLEFGAELRDTIPFIPAAKAHAPSERPSSPALASAVDACDRTIARAHDSEREFLLRKRA